MAKNRAAGISPGEAVEQAASLQHTALQQQLHAVQHTLDQIRAEQNEIGSNKMESFERNLDQIRVEQSEMQQRRFAENKTDNERDGVAQKMRSMATQLENLQAKLDRIAASREEVEMVAAPAARTREVQEMLARMDQKFESLLGELARDRTALAESLATDRATLAQVGSNVDLLQQGIQREQADAGSEEAARAVATEAAWRMEQKFTSLQAELSQIKSLPLSSPDRASIERAKIAGDAALRMDQKFEALRNELMQMLAEKEKLGQVTYIW